MSFCKVKYDRLDYVHQVINKTAQPQPTTPFRHATLGFDSYDAFTAQISELVQQLCTTLPSSSISKLVNLGNVSWVTNSFPSWVINSDANKHIFGISSSHSN